MASPADSLPGADLVARGLTDLRRGRETAAALLVAVARSRLEDLGTPVPALRGPPDPCPELRLYRLLRRTHPSDASSRYNALLRQIVSYTRAREHREQLERRQRDGTPPAASSALGDR